MSWAFFADLRLHISSDAWKKIITRRPAEIALPEGWSTLADVSLEESLGQSNTKKATFAEVTATYDVPGSIQRVEPTASGVEVRIAIGVDGSQLDQIQPLAALLWIAREMGGGGSLRLVDDGSLGMDGVELALKDGLIEKAETDDWEEIVEELARELSERKAPVNPFAGVKSAGEPKKRATKASPRKGSVEKTKRPAQPSAEPVMADVLAALENAVAGDFAGAAGAVLRRQRDAVGSNLDAECTRLEERGDERVVATLRAQIALLPKEARGSRKRIERSIELLTRRAGKQR